MSHFTVLIIGDNIEDQLAPYDESLEASPYRENETVDLAHIREYIEERRKDHADWVEAGKPPLDKSATGNDTYWKARGIEEIESGQTTLPAPDADDLEVVHFYHGKEYDRDENGQWYRMSTYNPDSKWDWYSIGGRWAGFFKTLAPAPEPNIPVNPFSAELTAQDREHFAKAGKLDGRHTDQARKRDIDFQGMRDDAAFKAGQRWDAYHRLVEGTPEALSWEDVSNAELAKIGLARDVEFSTLTTEQKEAHRNAINVARTVYAEQPRVQRMRNDKEFSWDNPEDYSATREEHCARAAANACSTYAVLLNGEWIAKGDMGWWGMSNDKHDQITWDERINQLIDEQDDDTLFTLVDCHI